MRRRRRGRRRGGTRIVYTQLSSSCERGRRRGGGGGERCTYTSTQVCRRAGKPSLSFFLIPFPTTHSSPPSLYRSKRRRNTSSGSRASQHSCPQLRCVTCPLSIATGLTPTLMKTRPSYETTSSTKDGWTEMNVFQLTRRSWGSSPMPLM